MTEPLRILLLEDNPADAELIQFERQESGMTFTSQIAVSKDDFMRGLREFTPDIILSDDDLPRYGGVQALADAMGLRPEAPFILISEAVSEVLAIEILTRGPRTMSCKTGSGSADGIGFASCYRMLEELP